MNNHLIDEKSKLIEQVYSRVPYSAQIKNLDAASEQDAIRFDWRGERYRVEASGHVQECQNGFLAGTDRAILMQALIQGMLP